MSFTNTTMLHPIRPVKQVRIKNIILGEKHVPIQSMLNLPSSDIDGNVKQAVLLENAGCEILRVSILDVASISLIDAIKKCINIPLVADIHFDYRLALESVSAGIDKIRINPGNIGDISKVKQVANMCKNNNVPIRIGVNSGSISNNILGKHGGPTPTAMVESALEHVTLLEKCDFDDIVISIKSSNVADTIAGYRMLAQKCNYPLHLGITEAGTERMGLIKSSMGIGALLIDGIGETIRVSLTAPPELEIKAAKDILLASGRAGGIEVISCPTCGRTKVNLIELVNTIDQQLKHPEILGVSLQPDTTIKIAVMGCAVNGPGEAREADLGLAGGDGEYLLFSKGEILRKVSEENAISELINEFKNRFGRN